MRSRLNQSHALLLELTNNAQTMHTNIKQTRPSGLLLCCIFFAVASGTIAACGSPTEAGCAEQCTGTAECNPQTGRCESRDGGQSAATHSNQLTAGSRLKVRTIVASDGAQLQLGFFDTQLDAGCAFRATGESPSKLRCLPSDILLVQAIYKDSGCTEQIIRHTSHFAAITAPWNGALPTLTGVGSLIPSTYQPSNFTGNSELETQVFDLEVPDAWFMPTTIYTLQTDINGTHCNPMTTNGQYIKLSDTHELQITNFIEGQIQNLPVP